MQLKRIVAEGIHYIDRGFDCMFKFCRNSSTAQLDAMTELQLWPHRLALASSWNAEMLGHARRAFTKQLKKSKRDLLKEIAECEAEVEAFKTNDQYESGCETSIKAKAFFTRLTKSIEWADQVWVCAWEGAEGNPVHTQEMVGLGGAPPLPTGGWTGLEPLCFLANNP